MKTRNIVRSKPLLGTLVEISISGSDRERIDNTISGSFNLVQKLEALLSSHALNSDVSRINALKPGESLIINGLTKEILTLSLELTQLSNGAFDVVCPCSENEANSNDILLHGNYLSVKRQLHIDLGGIAKGFIVDKVSENIITEGFSEYYVSAGGDIRFESLIPKPVYVRDPKSVNRLVEVGVGTSCACATSADYYRQVFKSDFGLYNPTSGPASYSNRSFTVISDSCAISDALTKIVALNSDLGERCLKRFNAISIDLQ